MIEKYRRASAFIRAPFIALTIVVLGAGSLCAQVKVLFVDPGQTDPAIASVHGPHLAVYDLHAVSRHRLFFFIAGTGAKATNSLALCRTFAKWGYPAITLDYENSVIATAFAHSLDPTSFDHYRNAIVTGAPGSDLIKVDAPNSILNRFQKLLVYLVKNDPQGRWDEFVQDGKPAWGRIMVAGHSQGSGHAAYIGKLFNVDRVLIFSGPQDYLADLHQPAPWLSGRSATPSSRFFAFLSQNDPFDSAHQEANCQVLMQLPKLETLAVKPGEAVPGDYQILVNDSPKKNAHGSTLSLQFTNVWDYMVSEKSR